MKRLSLLTVLLAVGFLLGGCGGGGGGNSTPVVIPPSNVPRSSVRGGYFGVVDNQISETYDHVQVVLIMDWGNWDTQQVSIQLRVIQQIQEAKARGLKSIVAVGFLTWDSKGNSKGTQYLEVFKTQLEALGLMDSIEAWYPIDEPDLAIKEGRITEVQLIDGIQRIHSVFPDNRFMTIYGDHGGYPALGWFDIVGEDKYPSGPVDPPAQPNQTGAIVAGGADPYRENPQAFYDYAMTHNNIEYIIYFLYSDYSDNKGNPLKGIRNNGMLEAYKAVGLKLKESQNVQTSH